MESKGEVGRGEGVGGGVIWMGGTGSRSVSGSGAAYWILNPQIFKEIMELKERNKWEVFVDQVRWLPWTVWEALSWHWQWNVARKVRKALAWAEDLWYGEEEDE